MLEDPSYDLVVLDELTYMVRYGYIDLDEIISYLKNRPENQSVIITGGDVTAISRIWQTPSVSCVRLNTRLTVVFRHRKVSTGNSSRKYSLLSQSLRLYGAIFLPVRQRCALFFGIDCWQRMNIN